MKNIAVVGGGTAGFVAALILKHAHPSLNVDVIRSTKIGTIGVGEGSTEHWTTFMKFVGIQPHEIIKYCDATFKSGIMFKGWGSKDYLQSVEGNFVGAHLNTPIVFSKLIGDNVIPKKLVYSKTWESEVPFNKFIGVGPDEISVTQYHFNTEKLNEFLTNKALSIGINIYDDEIKDVTINEDGIDTIIGNKTYDYDFYVDCTGFAKLLIGKMGASWQSYSKYLKMKEAIVFQTPDEEEYPYWTLAQAMNNGWMFRIPVWGRKGNGYIFDSDYITADDAQKEVEEFFGNNIEVRKHIKFDPGALDRSWIKNVCAIGLSASFVEPLEATSVGTSIQQSFLLASRIVNYNDATIDRYNTEINAVLDDIRDFIVLHYVTDRRDTQFWKDVSELELPSSLQHKLNMWKDRLPIADDFATNSSRVLFNEYNYAIVLHGLGLTNPESIKKQYDMLPESAKEYVNRVMFDRDDHEQNLKYIPHKIMIDLIRRLT